MTKKEAAQYLVKSLGLTPEEAQVVLAKADDSQLDGLRAQSELDAIVAEKAALEASYAKAKNYEDWYSKNAEAIQKLQTRHTKYVERFGDIDESGNPNPNPNPNAGTVTMTKDEIAKMVQEQINALTPTFESALVGMGQIADMHRQAGRKTSLDTAAIAKLAVNYGGDLVKAYKEWDAPAAEEARQAQAEAEIKRRVDEEVQKQLSQRSFPGGDGASVDSSPGILRERRTDSGSTADIRRGLLETARTGKYERAVQ